MTRAFALIAMCLLYVAGCKDDSKGGKPAAAAGDAAGSKAGAATDAGVAAAAVKLVTTPFELNGHPFTIDLPEGCVAVKGSFEGAFKRGEDFGLIVGGGARSFEYDKHWWTTGVGIYRPKKVEINTGDQFLVETDERGAAKFGVGARAEVPLVTLSVHGGDIGANVLTRENALLVLRCAATLKLKATPPTEPVAALEWANAKVSKGDDGQVESIRFVSTTDAALPLLKNFPKLRSLALEGTSGGGVSVAGLGQLAGMTGLEELSYEGGIGAPEINAAAIQAIAAIPNLKRLRLGAPVGTTNIDEAALGKLAALEKLERLSLKGTRAGDAALASIKALTHLKELDLTGTKVTDAGLAHLAEMKGLERVDLSDTSVTDAAKERLGKSKVK